MKIYRERKAVFFDIDGTLYHREDTRRVPPSTLEAIRRIQSGGNLAIICTGRCDAVVEPYLRDIGFDGYILGCGTHILFHGKELFYYTMKQEQIQWILDLCRRHGLMPILEGRYGLYIDEADCHGSCRQLYEFYKKFFPGKVYPISGCELEVSKMMGKFPERTPELVEAVINEIGGEMDVFDHGQALEMVPVGFDKGVGIDFLIEKLGISRENTYAFGDSANDISMFHRVRYPIALGDCQPELLAHSCYQTKELYQDGIYYACTKFGII